MIMVSPRIPVDMPAAMSYVATSTDNHRRRFYMKQLAVILSALLMICAMAGCAHKPVQEKSAQELADEGTRYFDKGRYKKSIEAFENLRDWYPFSKLTTLADLKVADAYFNMEEYESAVSAYENFERLHPRHESVPFVIFRTGLCHFNRLDTIDRDQTPAHRAIDAFSRLVRAYPDSEYASQATDYIHQCRESLAAHELYVAKFYFKTKRYRSALYRFKQIIEKYPDVGDIETARRHIPLCEEGLAEMEKEESKND
ncbi:DNA uptake lipoprotein-like protein [Desulfosudis oleivorans Hxd3]|uniref:DNA uptake lipoprotein-like protein n=2 Tax=Desulfosudis TaxID=2904716 RepID=A8ZTS6_DESOH|nr:DNA uptake lipoprotein-like protein [Desulfosudis oleivorans Hxd3]